MSIYASRRLGVRSSRGISPRLADAYADLWRDHGINYELTISLGIHPKTFDPVDMSKVLRRLVREATHQLRRVPKRQMLGLSADHPDVLFAAGFYEANSRAGELFPHWHGGVRLRPGEEPTFRRLLWECIGQDSDASLTLLDRPQTTRPLITLPNAKPTFHLAALSTPTKYISYANKQTTTDDIDFSTTRDFLA